MRYAAHTWVGIFFEKDPKAYNARKLRETTSPAFVGVVSIKIATVSNNKKLKLSYLSKRLRIASIALVF